MRLFLGVLLCVAGAPSAPALTPPRVALPEGTLRAGERIELTVTDVPEAANLYNPAVIRLDAEITAPDGGTVRVPGFAQPRTEPRQDNGETRYQPTGGYGWRVRFAAPAAGEYRGRVVVTTGDAVRAESAPFRLRVEAADRSFHGYVRVAKGNPAAFAYDDGTAFIPIGENLAYQTPRDRMTEWIAKLGASGANWVRVWPSNAPTFGVEGARAYEYSEDAARGLDAVVEACERAGVCATFCFDHIRNFGPPPRPPGSNYSFTFPYDARNGGPAATMRDVFTLPAARAQHEAALRYYVARWGYSRAVFAWELWNEMDSIYGNEGFRADLVRWVGDACGYLHANDPYHHLATTSLGSGGVWDELWRLPAIDFVNYHDYGGRAKFRDRSQVEVYAPVMAALGKFGKPVLFSEVGLVNEDWGPNDHVCPKRADKFVQDTDNRAFHEALWLPFFAGAAGGGLHWWWEEFDAFDVYPLYRAQADFLADVPLARAPMPAVEARASQKELQGFARGNDWGTVAWVWDRRASWQSLVLAGQPAGKVVGASVVLPAARGTFQVRCVDTRDGRELSRATIQAGATGLTVPLPEFSVDVAVKAVRASVP